MIKEHFLKINGTDIRVEETGEGQALFLLHGFSSDKCIWNDCWEILSRKHRVLRYDLRGFGESPSQFDEPFSHSEDLFEVLNSLEIQSCDLLGVSMGASIALNFSLNYPERVQSLVLVSPGITAWEWSDSWRDCWEKIVRIAKKDGVLAAKELWYKHPLFESTRRNKDAAEKLQKSLNNYSGSHWVSESSEIQSLPDLDRLPFLKPSTLLLTGTDDLLDFQLIASAIQALAPSVQRREYDSAGHMLNLEYPGRFARDVLEFL